MDVDPAASMRIWAVELNLGGRVFEIPALPAADWLPILMEGDTVAVLDLTEDPELDLMIISGEITPTELAAAIDAAVEQVAGRPVYQATVLAQVAQLQWTVVGGDLARRGFRWDEVPLGAALDAIHVTVLAHLRTTANQEETQAGLASPAERFRELMDGEPTPTTTTKSGARTRRRRPDRKAMADFENMAGPKPAPVRATAAQSGGGRPRTQPRSQRHPLAGR